MSPAFRPALQAPLPLCPDLGQDHSAAPLEAVVIYDIELQQVFLKGGGGEQQRRPVT